MHEYPYVQHLLNKCEQLTMTPHHRATPQSPHFCAPPGNLDCDTPLSQDSLDAARTFCGAAIAAVDVVLNPTSRQSDGCSSESPAGVYSAELDSVQVSYAVLRYAFISVICYAASVHASVFSYISAATLLLIHFLLLALNPTHLSAACHVLLLLLSTTI
mgnify:CR=1 FL=1